MFGNRMRRFRVVNTPSQTIDNSWRNSKQMFIKFYDDFDYGYVGIYFVLSLLIIYEFEKLSNDPRRGKIIRELQQRQRKLRLKM